MWLIPTGLRCIGRKVRLFGSQSNQRITTWRVLLNASEFYNISAIKFFCILQHNKNNVSLLRINMLTPWPPVISLAECHVIRNWTLLHFSINTGWPCGYLIYSNIIPFRCRRVHEPMSERDSYLYGVELVGVYVGKWVGWYGYLPIHFSTSFCCCRQEGKQAG